MAEHTPVKERPSKCKGPNCGKSVFWRVNERTGKMQPYDEDGASHFQTCCDRDLFRGGAIKTKKSDERRY